MIRCGITGSNGSIGSVVIKTISSFNFIKFNGDITNKIDVEKWIKKNNFDLIIHLAAIVPIKLVNENKKKAFDVNFIGTKNIIDSVLKFNNSLKWFFFSSTSHVYKSKFGKISENHITKPQNTYGRTKLKAENYIKKKLDKAEIKYCIGRIFSTTSINQKTNYFVPDIKKKVNQNNKSLLKFKNLDHYRDFISPYDISKILLLLWRKKYNGIINIASGNAILLKKIVLLILKRKNKKNFLFYDNKKKTSLVADISRLIKITGWRSGYSISDMLFKV
jgi:nucleoside-diphosphate-sugar epimerase